MSKVNFFVSNLTKSNAKIKESRAQRIGIEAEMEQRSLLDNLKRDQMRLTVQLEDLEDLSPDSTLSLNPTKGEFDGAGWVAQMQEIKIELANKDLEVELAQATYDKYFVAKEVKAPKEAKKEA